MGRSMIEQLHRGVEAQLRVVLDNMPGAIIYTDERLNIIFCNVQFRQMYAVPSELLETGRPYPTFLRYLAENGYYGKGDIDALVEIGRASCRERVEVSGVEGA